LHRDEFSVKNMGTDFQELDSVIRDQGATRDTVAGLEEVDRSFASLAKGSGGSRRGIANACGLCRSLYDSRFRKIPAVLYA
jgi:hypothetical protein